MTDANFLGATWFKASGSGEGGCVEVAVTTSLIGVRDTKDKGTGPILSFDPSAWTSFVEGLHHGEFAPEWLAL